jgi:hypothetical protein
MGNSPQKIFHGLTLRLLTLIPLWYFPPATRGGEFPQVILD